MSESIPIVSPPFGVGLPRLIMLIGRRTGFVLSNTADDGTSLICKTPFPHGLLPGQRIRFDIESDSSELSGDRLILTIPSENEFTIHISGASADTGGHFESLNDYYESSTSTTYDSTHAYESGTPDLTLVKVGMRISSYYGTGGNAIPTYAKVISITTGATASIEVDAWTAGTPSNANIFRLDGWIADLPRCQAMIETLDPDMLIHEIDLGDAGSRFDTEMRGFKYSCTLDYSRYISPDALYSLRHHLSQRLNDKLILIPRRDKPGRQFVVFYSDPISFSKYGRSVGYKRIVFSFRGVSNVSSVISEFSSTKYDGGI